MKNLVSAIFYIENIDLDNIEKEIDIAAKMVQKEKPEEIKLFINWLNNFFRDIDDKAEIKERIDNIHEVKDMFAEALKKRDQNKYSQGINRGKKEGKKEGLKAGMELAASNMLKEGVEISMISRITGLPVNEIQKLRQKKRKS